MTLEDAAGRGATDGQAVLSGEAFAVLVKGGVGRGGDLGGQQHLLVGRQPAGGTRTATGGQRLAGATPGAPAPEGTEADTGGAGDLGVAEAGVMGLPEPLTEIAGVGGGQTFSLGFSVNPYENRSSRRSGPPAR